MCNCTPEESSDHAEVTREGDDDEDGVETDQDRVGWLRHGLAAQVSVIVFLGSFFDVWKTFMTIFTFYDRSRESSFLFLDCGFHQ